MMLVPPSASEERNAKLCCSPLPLDGVTEMATGGLVSVGTVHVPFCVGPVSLVPSVTSIVMAWDPANACVNVTARVTVRLMPLQRSRTKRN